MGILSKPISIGDSCHEFGHTWNPSCVLSTVELSWIAFKYSCKLYAPLYLLAALLGKQDVQYYLKKIWLEIFQSSCFLSSVVGFQVVWFCLLRKLLGQFYMLTSGFLPGLLSSFFAIHIERKKRRGLLALYVFNVALETVYNILKDANVISHIPYGEILMFMASMSTMMFYYSSGYLQKGLIKSGLSFLLKSKNDETNQLSDIKYKDDDKEEIDLSVNFRTKRTLPHMNWCSVKDFISKDSIYYIESMKLIAKGFGVGYILQILPKLAYALPKLFKTQGKSLKTLLPYRN